MIMVRNIRKRKDDGRKLDKVTDFLGSLRSMESSGSRTPTTAAIEKALTEGPLYERTDLRVPELGGIVFLRSVGEHLGVPEYTREAAIWMETLISKDRKGRDELTRALIAKVEKEYELARIEAKQAETQAGRDRRG